MQQTTSAPIIKIKEEEDEDLRQQQQQLALKGCRDTDESLIGLGCGSCKEEMSGAILGARNCCAGCREPIRDKFIFSVIDLNWHQDCVQCSDCSLKLNERCYTFDGKLYCKLDYWRRFGPKCFACRESIERSELVQRINGNRVFHLECFTCSDCNRQLKAGEQLHLIDGKRLLCKQDYNQFTNSKQPLIGGKSNNNSNGFQEQAYYTLMGNEDNNNKSSLQLHRANQHDQIKLESPLQDSKLCATVDSNLMANDDLDDDEDRSSIAEGDQQTSDSMQYYNRSMAGDVSGGKNDDSKGSNLVDCGDDLVDANGKRRGPRTTIKPKQLETLRRAFDQAPKPSRHMREALANETGLNMRVIQVWFQNRRSKERRMKNSNGGTRRNFFRSSSRRLRVGPTANTPTTNGVTPTTNPSSGQQQSLIAGARTLAPAKQSKVNQQQPASQQQLSPLEPSEQLHNAAGQAQQQQGRQGHNSPSEFGGSSSGGFTYFSDSSNQGEAFAINTSGHQQQSQGSLQLQQQQYLPNGAQDQNTLMALESPSGGNRAQANQAVRTQQQYGQHQLMKNTPPPQTPMYQTSQAPPHMMMANGHQIPGVGPPGGGGGGGGNPLQHQHPHPNQHSHLGANQMMQPAQSRGIGGLLGHPQGPSVVQW